MATHYMLRKMPEKVRIVALFLVIGANPAFSETFTCKFTSYTSESTENDILWLGDGFVADSNGERVKKTFAKKKTDWIKTDVTKSEGFTSFKFKVESKDGEGTISQVRYGYRAYNDGRCKAYVGSKGKAPLQAEGRLE